jgi:HlyD family secretion protein
MNLEIIRDPFFRALNVCVLCVIASLVGGCNNTDNTSDAYGNFEAEEVIVSSENNGTLLNFSIQEGDVLEAGTQVALIDTTLYALNLKQLRISLEQISASKVQLEKSIDVQEENLRVLKQEVDRVTRLYDENAIPAQKYDEVTGQYAIAQKKLQEIHSRKLSLSAEQAVVNSKIETAKEKLARCRVLTPINGTVLQKYAEKGEFTAVGKPLFKIAHTSELILRTYISGSQLDDVKIGQVVLVKYDKTKSDEYQTKGQITWIASTAEFTPKIIQTKEERVDLVYAIKVRVPNSKGRIKIGMPGEVIFDEF